jgi:hypothetical protein
VCVREESCEDGRGVFFWKKMRFGWQGKVAALARQTKWLLGRVKMKERRREAAE